MQRRWSPSRTTERHGPRRRSTPEIFGERIVWKVHLRESRAPFEDEIPSRRFRGEGAQDNRQGLTPLNVPTRT